MGKVANWVNKLLGNNPDTGNKNVYGTPGTEIYSGYIEEDYLQLDNLIPTYDKMRRSDAKVVTLLSVTKNPIQQMSWYLEPFDNSEQSLMYKQFFEDVLFNDIDFDQFISEALTVVDYGFSAFEIVYQKKDKYITLKKLGYRNQKTIEKFNVDNHGNLLSVTQCAYGDLQVNVDIPANKLLLFTNQLEGANYSGISKLRAIYGNWLRKNSYLKIAQQGIQRAVTGFPVATYSTGQDNNAAVKQLEEYLTNINSGISGYVIHPKDTIDIKFEKIDFDAKAIQDLIEYEDKAMSQAFLASFVDLGVMTSSGSYSLGSSQVDMFFNQLEIYPKMISSKINKLIKRLGYINFNTTENMPILRYSGLNDSKGKEFAEVVTMLTSAGLVKPDKDLIKQMHKEFDLPEPVEIEENTTMSDIYLAEEEPQNYDNVQKLMIKIIDDLDVSLGDQFRSEAKKVAKDLDYKMKIDLEKPIKDIKEGLVAALNQVKQELEMEDVEKFFDKGTNSNKVLLAAFKKIEDELKENTKFLENDIYKEATFAHRNGNLSNAEKLTDVQDDLKKRLNVLVADLGNKVVNYLREEVVKNPDFSEEIDSLIFTNPAPEADICIALAGSVFTTKEYNNSGYILPFHHNEKTYLEFQGKRKLDKKPLTGLKSKNSLTEKEQGSMTL